MKVDIYHENFLHIDYYVFFDRNETWFGLAELILFDLHIVCNDFIKCVTIYENLIITSLKYMIFLVYLWFLTLILSLNIILWFILINMINIKIG